MYDTQFGFMSAFGTIFIVAVFIILIAGITFGIVSSIKQQRYNNSQPILNVEAKIVTKRSDVSSSISNEDNFHSTSTTYYITFEVESGSRIEFQVNGQIYGSCAEGDIGKLTFQGTKYIGFERNGYRTQVLNRCQIL